MGQIGSVAKRVLERMDALLDETDEQGRMQPVAPHWNPSGYLWNVIDRVRITVHAS